MLAQNNYLYIMGKFDRAIRKINAIVNINENELLGMILSQPEIKEFIIILNTRKQLFDKGINSLGITLESIGGPYSPNTIEGTASFAGKKELGLPFDRITLFNTGDYHKTWKIEIPISRFATIIKISSNPIKNGTNLLEQWGEEVEGLTQESKQALRDKIRPILPQVIRQIHQAA